MNEMRKKVYIQPNIKLHFHALKQSLMNAGSEQGNDAGDSEGKDAMMDGDNSDAWGKVDW